MNKRLPLLAIPLLLSACLGRQEAIVPASNFDFSPVAVASQHTLPAAEVLLPAWLNGQSVQYRLLYRDPNELREYAYARWAGTPAALIQQRLRARLAGVLGENCRLQVHLQEFAQAFSSEKLSTGELRGELRLMDRQHKLLATRYVSYSQPAPSADARGGVTALAESVDRLAEAVQLWVKEDKRIASCGQGLVAKK